MTEEESKLKQEELKYKEETVYGVAKKYVKRKQTVLTQTLEVEKVDAAVGTDITFSNISVKYTKKELSQLNNSKTGGVGTEAYYTEKPDKKFPIIGFEQGFEALDSNSFSKLCYRNRT